MCLLLEPPERCGCLWIVTHRYLTPNPENASLSHLRAAPACGKRAMCAIEEVIMPYEKIDVECYSGYKANERPVAFTYQKCLGK